MSARTVGLLLWLALGGLAAMALAWQLKHPPQPPAVRAAPPLELPVAAPLEPFRLPPPGQYSAVGIRPLFLAERRPEPPPPPDEAPPEKPAPGPEQKFTLFGVMIAPGAQAALLRLEEPGARTARVKVGEKIGEWNLDAVLPDHVVLRKGETTQELPLTRPRKPGKPHAKRTGDQPGQNAAPQPHQPQPQVPPMAPSINVPVGPTGMPAAPPTDALIAPIAPGPMQ
ncbi:MAG: type II secretion system protein N [Candidatus Contendobacter sp.]|nr:type II secretion system protein N [Candidatus Contendobacter sp.]